MPSASQEIANLVLAGLPLTLMMAVSEVVKAVLETVGAEGVLARVYLLVPVVIVVSTLSPLREISL